MPLKNEFWTTPNQLTLMRLFFIPFINICIVEQRYHAALVLVVIAGLSDGLDGLAARLLHQKTKLGEYLDPIADKLLLSSLFLVMSSNRMIPWRYTVMVFSRDLSILIISALLYTVGLRDFRPGIFGKINTACQIAAVFFALLVKVYPDGGGVDDAGCTALRSLRFHPGFGDSLRFFDRAAAEEIAGDRVEMDGEPLETVANLERPI